MKALFASDVHLSQKRPEIVAAFCGFLRLAAASADRLYLLGDVFDEWLGDDDARDPHGVVEAELRALTDAGCEVFFAHGNHDFLIGEAFLARTGVQLLDGQVVHELPGQRALLTHGDELCTEDKAYQAFRAQVRNPAVQAQFLGLPFEARVAEAARLRANSAEAVKLKAADIMDVTQDAVESVLREHAVACLVHGHTHRPDIHQFDLDGSAARRIVLGDWYEQDSVLIWDENGQLDEFTEFADTALIESLALKVSG